MESEQMGEAKRRYGAGEARQERDEAIGQFNREAGRLYSGRIIRVGSPVNAKDRVMALNFIIGVARQVADGGDTALCLTCETEFPPVRPTAILMVTGHCDDPSVGIMTGICGACSKRSDAELFDAWIELSNKAGNDIRKIPAEALWHAAAAGRQ
jgi:hypothetical protein